MDDIFDLIESLNINKPYSHEDDNGNISKIKDLMKNMEDDKVCSLIHLSLNSLSSDVLEIIYKHNPKQFKVVLKDSEFVDSLFSKSCCEFDYDPFVLECLKILYKEEIDSEITDEIITNCIHMMFIKCLNFLKDYGFNFYKYKDIFIESELYYEDEDIKTDDDIIKLIDNVYDIESL